MKLSVVMVLCSSCNACACWLFVAVAVLTGDQGAQILFEMRKEKGSPVYADTHLD